MTDTTDGANLDTTGGNDQQTTDSGNTPPAWTAQLDKDLQANERLTSFKTIGEMGKAFLDTEGKLSKAIIIPDEKATDEEKAAYREKMGIPDSPDKYSFKKPEGLPEGLPYSEEAEASYKQFALENGIPDKQAAAIFNWYHELAKTGYEQQQKAEQQVLDAAVNALKDEWKGDAFKENSELAVRAFTKFGGDEAKQFIETTKINGLALGDHPVFLKIFAQIGKAISDDSAMADRRSHGAEMSDEERARKMFPNTQFKD